MILSELEDVLLWDFIYTSNKSTNLIDNKVMLLVGTYENKYKNVTKIVAALLLYASLVLVSNEYIFEVQAKLQKGYCG